jgi:Sec-independent protein secretion pathway component TatC
VPETETSKPFLEHLEDLRWTIVKMAITLSAAMIVCFAFRSTLVRILQAPLRDVGITNRNAEGARHHRFDRDFISSGVLRRHRSLLSAAALFSLRNLFFLRLPQ